MYAFVREYPFNEPDAFLDVSIIVYGISMHVLFHSLKENMKNESGSLKLQNIVKCLNN